MIKFSKIFIIIYTFYSFFTSIAYSDNINNEQISNFLYVGTELGIVEPIIAKFRHKHSKTDITLKRSPMYSGKIGYSFYPQMAVEFSFTHQPKYNLSYVLPEKNLENGMTIPKTPGKTTVISNIFMLNLIYDLAEVKGFTPFVILGGGIAQIKVKSTSSRWDTINRDFFKVKTTRTNCPAWQVGLGFSKNITPSFSLDIAAKLQVANGVKINYDTLELASQKFVAASPIKKTIGVGEFGIGFTYRLPV